PRPLALPSSRHDERVLLRPSALPVPAVDPCDSPFSASDAEVTSSSTPSARLPLSPAPTGSACPSERAPCLSPSTVGAAVMPLPVGASADRASLPLLVGPSDQLLRPKVATPGTGSPAARVAVGFRACTGCGPCLS